MVKFIEQTSYTAPHIDNNDNWQFTVRNVNRTINAFYDLHKATNYDHRLKLFCCSFTFLLILLVFGWRENLSNVLLICLIIIDFKKALCVRHSLQATFLSANNTKWSITETKRISTRFNRMQFQHLPYSTFTFLRDEWKGVMLQYVKKYLIYCFFRSFFLLVDFSFFSLFHFTSSFGTSDKR